MILKFMKNLKTRIQHQAAAGVELSVDPNADDTERQEWVKIKWAVDLGWKWEYKKKYQNATINLET